jgi:hypothetical protein
MSEGAFRNRIIARNIQKVLRVSRNVARRNFSWKKPWTRRPRRKAAREEPPEPEDL